MDSNREAKEISAVEFVKAWDMISSGFLNPETGNFTDDALMAWKKDKQWTEFLLGTARRSGRESFLGGKLKKYFGDLEYRTEDNKVDLVLVRQPRFEIVYGKSGDARVLKEFFPRYFDILVEHENSLDSAWREMAKLVNLKARLKVLITYVKMAKKGGSTHQDAIDRLKENCSSIISQANAGLSEDPRTEYVLIIGQKQETETGSFPKWHNFVFDIKGKVVGWSSSPIQK